MLQGLHFARVCSLPAASICHYGSSLEPLHALGFIGQRHGCRLVHVHKAHVHALWPCIHVENSSLWVHHTAAPLIKPSIGGLHRCSPLSTTAHCTAPTPDSTYYQGHVSGKPDFPQIVSHKRYGAHSSCEPCRSYCWAPSYAGQSFVLRMIQLTRSAPYILVKLQQWPTHTSYCTGLLHCSGCENASPSQTVPVEQSLYKMRWPTCMCHGVPWCARRMGACVRPFSKGAQQLPQQPEPAARCQADICTLSCAGPIAALPRSHALDLTTPGTLAAPCILALPWSGSDRLASCCRQARDSGTRKGNKVVWLLQAHV